MAKKKQIPYYFYFPDKRVFSVAGLWEENEDSDSSFIMITKSSNKLLSEFYDDMPAILDASKSRKWLETESLVDLEELLSDDQSSELNSHTVSPKIRDIESNDVSLINQAPASDQHGNYTLFT